MFSKKRAIFVVLCLISTICSVWGQDVQFSQYYAAPTHLNPAFAGGAHHHRAMFHQRLQWPRLNAKYITSMLSYDFFDARYQSGYGIMLLQDYQGSNNISSTELHAQYAYELPLSKVWSVRAGLQAGLVTRTLNYADLTFPQQYDDFGFTGMPHDYNEFGKQRKIYPDIASGIVAYTDDFWFSFAGHHLNLPNQSFIGEVERLPIKFSFGAGYKIHLTERHKMAYLSQDDEFSVTPVIHYKFQGKSDQTDFGAYLIYNQILVGGWYRGMPIKRFQKTLQNNESFILMSGWRYNNFTFSYSYDFILSTLRPSRTGGAHEINITYVHNKKHHKKPRKRLPCPTFYKNHL